MAAPVSLWHAQRGQVLVLGLVLAAALSLAWWRYFMLGQVVADKARLLNGLDAAAYSGALVQARTLNQLAYVNRAQVAHQLAMAHLVTLASWAQFGGMEARRLALGNPPAHLIGLFFGAPQGRAYLAAASAAGLEASARPTGDLGQAYARHEAFIHDHLAALSVALIRDLPDRRASAQHAVLVAHYPDQDPNRLWPEVRADAWPLRVHSSAARATLADELRTLARHYAFLDPRDYTARASWVVSGRCPALRHELRRRGTSVLDSTGRWRAVDTLSLHAVRSNRWIGCYYREYAMGWAWMPNTPGQSLDAPYTREAPDDFSAQDFWRWVAASTDWDLVGGQANPMANSYAMRDQHLWRSRGLGLQAVVDSDGSREGAIGFQLRLRLPDGPQGPLVAASAAESYFLRPGARLDGRREAPNLYHPFWHARLAPVSEPTDAGDPS